MQDTRKLQTAIFCHCLWKHIIPHGHWGKQEVLRLTKALWFCRCGKQQWWDPGAGSHQHPLGARCCHPQKVRGHCSTSWLHMCVFHSECCFIVFFSNGNLQARCLLFAIKWNLCSAVSDLRSVSTSLCQRSQLGLRCSVFIWATRHTAWARPTCGSLPAKQTATLEPTLASSSETLSCSLLGRFSLPHTSKRWAHYKRSTKKLLNHQILWAELCLLLIILKYDL